MILRPRKRVAISTLSAMAVSLYGLLSPTMGESTEVWVEKPGLFQALTEPPCSYCVNEHRKGYVQLNDPVVAWIRPAHNGGAVPIRHFLSRPRVINDTYGLFFYDPDGGYVTAFKKDYGYEFFGWRNGVMTVKGPDGTIWSALSGRGLRGPKKGRWLEPIPSFVTEWGHWLMLHPESTAYDLFDGKKYPTTPLPQTISAPAKTALAKADKRLPAKQSVHGVFVNGEAKVYALRSDLERTCVNDTVGGTQLAVFHYQPTQSSIAFNRRVEGRILTFYADDISPETAPSKDRETGTRWTLAGRAVDGPLRGQELDWVRGVQCRWFAWSAEYPNTAIYETD